ncbi:MAG TPA: methyltransferase domain-containing protein [Solirubrobacteraceae bacterium]|jgi:SAM-dependent methyltransferase
MSIDVPGIKQGQKMMWSAGDYPDIARRIESVAATLVDRVGVAPAIDLLDVATGSGNVAILAAQAGARVTGLDLTPELLDAARARAADGGLEIDFIEGDAEELPFQDGSFDRVTSCFGVMFAPRQQLAARELTRVARPGSRIAIAAWTPEGLNGRMFKTIASYMPAPAPELDPPVAWGKEDHVRELFADSGAELSFERLDVRFEHDSPESWVAYNERVLGPSIMAKAALEPQGRYDALRGDLLELFGSANEAGEDGFRVSAQYLLTLLTMPA